jgi:hypothetical protein
MKRFAVIDQQGNILRTGVCSDGDFMLQGEIVLEAPSEISDTTHVYKNGQFVALEQFETD